MTRTFSFGKPNICASTLRRLTTPCVESYSVSISPSQIAVVACSSSGLWVSAGVTYVSSSLTGAFANAPSGSPRSLCNRWRLAEGRDHDFWIVVRLPDRSRRSAFPWRRSRAPHRRRLWRFRTCPPQPARCTARSSESRHLRMAAGALRRCRSKPGAGLRAKDLSDVPAMKDRRARPASSRQRPCRA